MDRYLPQPTFTNKLVEARASLKHGLGIFAKVDIKKGKKICDYEGEEITYSEFKARYKNDWNYCYKGGWLFVIVAKGEKYLQKNPCNYINEVNEGETVSVVLKKRALYAACDIKAGEELLFKYHKGYNRYWLKEKDGYEDCEHCGYNHHYEDKCPN